MEGFFVSNAQRSTQKETDSNYVVRNGPLITLMVIKVSKHTILERLLEKRVRRFSKKDNIHS